MKRNSVTCRKFSDGGQGEVRGFSVNSYKRCGGRKRKISPISSPRSSISRKISSCTMPYVSSFGFKGFLLIVLAYSGRWTNFSKVPAGHMERSKDEFALSDQFLLGEGSTLFQENSRHPYGYSGHSGIFRYVWTGCEMDHTIILIFDL